MPEPTCDLNDCDDRGWARYRHVRREEWITTCRSHTPRILHPATFEGTPLYFHTRSAECYPASEPAEVHG